MFKLIFVAAATLWSMHLSAQQYSLFGKVLEADGDKPLTSATVQVKELNQIAVTDDSGYFKISHIPAGEYTVVVRFLGFVNQIERISLTENLEHTFHLEESTQLTDEVVVYATRANENTPTTFVEMNKGAIQKQNFGQDLPLILNWTPSMVTTSDAGAGIGYTGLRIRGSDASRINVTINGIALNDSESQGVFWVNTPDLASSMQSIQIQRGVGTSTNGAGAFGGTVSVQTDALSQDPYAEVAASAGSFRSQRYTVKTGTGLINSRWAFDGRLSMVKSDGYLERASSDLNSYYLSGGYYGSKTIIKAIMFGGREQTYQAWYGTDQATLESDRRFNYAGAIYDADGNILRYYDNEVDHYQQDHYQLHLSQQLSAHWNVTVAGHYTYGRGYYEQYKQGEAFASLGLPNAVIGNEEIESSDVIVRRWLDNQYYGATFSAHYANNKTDLTVGGAASQYANARHFGEIIWSEIGVDAPIRYVYYDGESDKTDANLYAKWNYKLTNNLSAYLDLQYRTIHYQTAGVDDDQSEYSVNDRFNFFNPKAGLSYALSENSQLYTSYAVANREPNRSDYLEGSEKPRSEKLGNLEIGWRRYRRSFALEANYYLMHYTDQLVLTGAVSDTGYPIRANVGKSYRTGIELSGTVRLGKKVTWNSNATWSMNKNKNFTVFKEDGSQLRKNTTIILSPSWIAGSQLTWMPIERLQASLLSKYVGKQYLDNSEDDNLKLAPYFINDIRLSYKIKPRGIKEIEFGFLANNIFDVKYASNGYGYGGSAYYFPQAGTNFLAMLNVKI